jgi:hypothetical protein
MITSRDIQEAANLLVKQFGHDALGFAARCADYLALKGDRDGEALWLRVSRAVKSIDEARPGSRVSS